MNEDKSEMNIYQKLQYIHSKVAYIKKSQKATQYTYAGSSDVLGQIHGLMDEVHLLLMPEVVEQTLTDSTDKRGTTVYMTELVIDYEWINADKPEERFTKRFYAQGIDRAGEKGVGKALTYGEKYYLLKTFQIATDNDDPDAFQKRIDSTKPQALISDDDLATVNKLIKEAADKTGTDANEIKSEIIKIAQVKRLENITENRVYDMINWIKKQYQIV